MPRYIDADAFFLDFPEIRDYEYASQEYEADVVEKELYNRLLENATIMAEALNKYQTADEVERT